MPAFGPGNVEIVGESVELAPSAARTEAGNGVTIDSREQTTLRLLLDVTAVSGTSPTLTVTIEQSYDGTVWRTHSSFAEVTSVSNERKTFGGIDRYVRASWTIGGSDPSVTFVVAGQLI